MTKASKGDIVLVTKILGVPRSVALECENTLGEVWHLEHNCVLVRFPNGDSWYVSDENYTVVYDYS